MPKATSPGTQLAFIDTGVAGWQQLAHVLSPLAEVQLLDSDRDGLSQFPTVDGAGAIAGDSILKIGRVSTRPKQSKLRVSSTPSERLQAQQRIRRWTALRATTPPGSMPFRVERHRFMGPARARAGWVEGG